MRPTKRTSTEHQRANKVWPTKMLLMNSYGRVTAGEHINATVSVAAFGSDLIVRSGLKSRKLNAQNITSWQEVPTEPKKSSFTALGQATAKAAFPGRLGQAASAGVSAALSTRRPSRTVRVHWSNDKYSLVKLPDALFTHLELALPELQIASPQSDEYSAEPSVQPPQSIADKTFDLISGVVKDRLPRTPTISSSDEENRDDVIKQLSRLASLRDAGVLTEDEFNMKKNELLKRL